MSIELLMYIILFAGYCIIFLFILLAGLAIFNPLRYKFRKYIYDENIRPGISVVVPAHNEEKLIERTILRFIYSLYPTDKKELVIVNDGSNDDTEKIIRKYAYKIIDSETGLATYKKQIQPLPLNKNIVLVNRKIGGMGKAEVLNDAKKYAQGELLFVMDADVGLTKDSLLRSVRYFADPRVGAVIGYFSIIDRGDILTGFINFEFTLGQKIQRVGYDTLGIHYIIPGACGIFRSSLFDLLGDYKTDTLAEDTDMSFRLLSKTNQKVIYDSSIQVEVDDPIKLTSLWKQRIRWQRGNIEVTKKYFKNFGNPKFGKGFTLGIPFWMATIIFPLGFVLTAATFLTMNLLDISLGPFLVGSRIIAYAFFAAIAYVIVLTRGKNALHGIISPGIPMLLTMSTAIVFPNGLFDLMLIMGYPEHTKIFVITLLMWMIFSIGLSYGAIRLSNRFSKTANFIQLIVFGYWSILMAVGIYSHYKELKGDERLWTRTER